MTIRPAVPEEFPAIAELCASVYAPFVGGDHMYMTELRNVAARAAAAELLVAADDDVLGTVTFVPDGGPLGEIAQPGETEFRMLAVDARAGGRGVGTALTRWIVDESRARGYAGVVCSTLPTMTTAHRIYQRLGFTRAPERDWSPVAGVDLLTFALVL